MVRLVPGRSGYFAATTLVANAFQPYSYPVMEGHAECGHQRLTPPSSGRKDRDTHN